MDSSSDLSIVRIGAEHPSLPGHFPGRPIVPGVVLLNAVIARAERWLGYPIKITRLQQAKFTQPLLPEEEATLSMTITGSDLKFEINRADQRIAQGSFKLDSGPLE